MNATAEHTASHNARDYLTVIIAEQRFGIPVLQVQDVLREQKVTRIPLASPEIAGSLNLRGRIVTAIDVRRKLGIENSQAIENSMSVVVEYKNELYSLIIDRVGDVLSLQNDLFEKNPSTLDPVWRDVSMGIYQLKGELMVVMDVPKLLESIAA